MFDGVVRANADPSPLTRRPTLKLPGECIDPAHQRFITERGIWRLNRNMMTVEAGGPVNPVDRLHGLLKALRR